jgi:hypothetical protein
MGEPLKPDELALFQKLTERKEPPTERVDEFVAVVGRRGGKSRAIAVLLVYLSCLVNYRPRLATGETGVCLCLSPSQEQSKIILDYCSGILEGSPILRQLIRRETSETIELTNGVTINVRSASFRRLRGQTCVAAVFDECAFFYSDESSNPDTEIIAAVKPSLATVNGILVAISSPHSRKGILWEYYRDHFGPAGDKSILVAKGATRELNESFPQSKVDAAYAKDASFAAAEYGAAFRVDLEGFVTAESVEACIEPGVRERGHLRTYQYTAFVDPSGGSRDSFAMAISHREGDHAIIDVIREVRAPCDPESAIEQFCQVLRQYHVYSVRGDRYAGEWPVQAFQKRGVIYEVSDKSKSELYTTLLPLINSRRVALLDDQVLRHQLTGLERRTSAAGRDAVDHGRGGKDDVANVVAGAAVFAGQTPGDPKFWGPLPYSKRGGLV